jgi:hypothetical protein
VTTIATDYEGKQFAFEIDDRKAWLVYLLVPCVLQSANMTANIIPSLVPRDKYLCLDIKHARAVLEQCIERETKRGLKKLATAERQIKTLNAKAKRTNRSRLALTAALCLALPSLSRKKLAGAIGVTPAGAGYLLNQLKGVTV